MTDFLGHLAARSLELAPVVQPRLASLFEPPGAPAVSVTGLGFDAPETSPAGSEAEAPVHAARQPAAHPVAERPAPAEAGPLPEPPEPAPAPRRRKRAGAPREAVVAAEDTKDSKDTKDTKDIKDTKAPRTGIAVPSSEPLASLASLKPFSASEERPHPPGEGRKAENLLSVSPLPAGEWAGDGRGAGGEGRPGPATLPLPGVASRPAALAPVPRRSESPRPSAPERLREAPPRREAGEERREPSASETALRPADPPLPPASAPPSLAGVVAHPRIERAAPLPLAPPAAAPAQTIQVTIGRIEVRAMAASAPASLPARRASAPAVMTLDEYLRRRDGERR